MDENNSSSIFTQAKIEYTQQLIDVLTPNMFDGVKSIYEESKIFFSTQTNQSVLSIFRTFLEKVPEWNNALVETETERIIKESQCDWLDDLVTAVFISHTKILTSIGPNMNNTRINLTIPKTINFIHKCYINLARELWKNPYLFDENINGTDFQRNMRTIEIIIKESIENTIRKLLPFKEILKEHLNTFDNNEIETQKRLENQSLQNLLLQEIRSLKNNQNNSDNSDNEDQEEENNSPDKKEQLNNIVNNIITDDNGNNYEIVEEYDEPPNNDGYVSPDEEQIARQVEDIEINTIQDITDNSNDNTTEEIKYDNPDIISNNYENDNIDTFKNNLLNLENNKVNDYDNDNILSPRIINIENNESPQSPNEEPIQLEEPKQEEAPIQFEEPIQVVEPKKVEEPIQVEEPVQVKEPKQIEVQETSNEEEKIPENNLNSELKGIIMGNKPVKENKKKKNEIQDIVIVKRDEISDIKEDEISEEPVKSLTSENLNNNLKEIISVVKMDDDNETVDDFVNDINAILEKKGEQIEKTTTKYTLFDDADDNE